MNDINKKIQEELQNLKNSKVAKRTDKQLAASDTFSSQMSERMRDPAYVKKVSEGNRKKAQNPDWQKKNREILKQRHNNPEWLEKMQALGEKKSNDPEFQAKMDSINKEKAKDPNWRKATKKGAQKRSKKKSWKEANKKANRDTKKIEHQKQFVTGRNSSLYKGDYIGTCIATGKEIRAIGAKGLKELGFSPGMVSECCSGKRETAKGYRWRREKIS